MPEAKRVRLRLLPDGAFRNGLEAGWHGKVLDVDLLEHDGRPELDAGAPVEVESQSNVYLGVLQECRTAGVSILVEHSLERSQVGWIEDIWG
jgi:hypothetical protein